METTATNGLPACGCVGCSQMAAKGDLLEPDSPRLLALNCAIIIFSAFSLFITLLKSMFKTLLRLYFLMVVNRLICALSVFSFMRWIRSLGRSGPRALFLLHFVSQANYIGIAAVAISTKVSGSFSDYPLKPIDSLNVFLSLCFTIILTLEIINLVHVCSVFPETQRRLVVSKPAASEQDQKLNLCVFVLFGYSLFADCVYIICSVVAYLEHTLSSGYYTESILCSLSGICACISLIGLVLGISFLSFMRDSRASKTAVN